MSEFYGNIVENLKKEAKHLNGKLLYCRNKDDMNGYIATLKSLKETLELIKKYDWQLMYSEYGVENTEAMNNINDALDIAKYSGEDPIVINYIFKKKEELKNNPIITEIAVWEQNHEGQIRNRKKWTTNIPYKKGISIIDENGVTTCHIGIFATNKYGIKIN